MTGKPNTSNYVCVCWKLSVSKPIFCKICQSPFHPICTRSITLDDGTYAKCCKPRNKSPSDNLEVSSVSTIGETVIQSIVYRAIGSLLSSFSKVNDSVTLIGNKLDAMSCKLDDADSRLDRNEARVEIVESILLELEGTVTLNSEKLHS